MEFSEDIGSGQYHINGYDDYSVIINQQKYIHSLIIMPNTLLTTWRPKSIEDLTANDWTLLNEFDLEVVLLGTGRQLIFPHPEQTAPLVTRQLGFEIMDTATCCRTYTILMSEERLVAAALII